MQCVFLDLDGYPEQEVNGETREGNPGGIQLRRVSELRQ